MKRKIIVVNNPKGWPLQIKETELVSAKRYILDPIFSTGPGLKVFNLCRSYRYQTIGYYVSLLAEARGHKPIPRTTTIQDMKSQSMIRFVSDDIDDLIQKSLSRVKSDRLTLSVYFGRNLAKAYDRLSSRIFKEFHAPFLRAQFVFQKKWILLSVQPIAANDIPDNHRSFVVSVAEEFFSKHPQMKPRRAIPRFDLAILHKPNEPNSPSDSKAIQSFIKAATSLKFGVEIIGKEDYGRLSEFDALFIRETTRVNHYTFRFARKAAAEGLVVIDDPESILKCTNKVFLAELLERHKIPTPKTMIVHRENLEHVEKELGFPCILKKPDSYFSQGVMKVMDSADLEKTAKEMLEDSDLIIGQEFLPTDYDWRVGILDRKPLFVCKYFMAENHWQIIRQDAGGNRVEGSVETIPVDQAPPKLLRVALKAANLIGNGLYGVDLKQVGKDFIVIEVNDNPNIDSGFEDAVLKENLYRQIVLYFLTQLESR